MVLWKSNCICSRNLAVNADKASAELSRELIEKLRNPSQQIKTTLAIEP